ncbi:hypothetical protein ABE61_17145 [Lysinibacillus sphaericus]|nr:hypothetical protein [Lysinibacillus sphaericus]MBG9477752.1 hypothetical protein [Lysinibacillus sphaericus]MBG9593211.1 hypothetical protein [Lysinibacillus sphaericus]
MLEQFKIRTQCLSVRKRSDSNKCFLCEKRSDSNNYAKAKLIKKGGCIISIVIVKNGTLHSGGIQDGLEDVVWDIDRWENDGGRSIGTRRGF